MILSVPADDGSKFPTLGPQVVDWMHANLVFGPGDLRGTPLVLDAEQQALIWRLYELFPKGHSQEGRRRFSRCAISLAKGLRKTELAACIAAAELHADAPVRFNGWQGRSSRLELGKGVTDPFVVLVAYTEIQSDELAYGALKTIIEESPLAQDFDIGLERIMRKTGGGKAVSLSNSPNSNDGARTTFQHFDEPLALNTIVPTPAGWKTIGEIETGDYVFGRHGEAVQVVGVSPVKEGRPCYRVTFDNGQAVVTDDSHRWTAMDWRNRPAGEIQVSTGDMHRGGVDTGYGKRWRLPRSEGFDGVEAILPISPYLLGMWLGDGATNAGYIHSAPDDYQHLSAGVEHTVSDDARDSRVRWLPARLRTLLRTSGLLGDKHIPPDYLFAARHQRVELLRGLMDSDGHTTADGNCTFVQKHRKLCEEVAVLVRSLGVNATVTESPDARSHTGSMFKTHFSPFFAPFRLARKASAATWRQRRSCSWPSIASIEPVESVPVRCIGVNSDDHLFLVGFGLHLTHNTHRFTLPRLKQAYQTMQANLPKRKMADAWSLETTTAPEPGAGSVAEKTMDYADSVMESKLTDTTLFFFHRQASEHHDLKTVEGARAAVIEASGSAASWRNIDAVVQLWRDPTTDRAYWERVWCNRLVKGSSQAFDVGLWATLKRVESPIKSGRHIVLGFDGAMFHDSTGLVATDIETGYQWVAGLWECPRGYDPNRNDGPRWQVPVEDVDETVRDLFARYKVWRMYADPPYWQSYIAQWSGDLGPDNVLEWWTTRRNKMAAAIENFDSAIRGATISHDGNPDLARHLGNARKQELPQRDENGKAIWVIRKERKDSPHKIDLAMASILSWEARTDAVAAGVTSAVPDYQIYVFGA